MLIIEGHNTECSLVPKLKMGEEIQRRANWFPQEMQQVSK